MSVVKYFLLLLGVCGLCQSLEVSKLCASALWGNTGKIEDSVPSQKTVLPPGQQVYRLAIADGNKVCLNHKQMTFVGVKVISCDTDVAPSVAFEKNDYTVAIVTRLGFFLGAGSVQAIYYCHPFVRSNNNDAIAA